MSFVVLSHRGMGPTATLPEITPDILPENSIAAFDEALYIGGDGIELDVHMTANGAIAVIHDNELNKKLAGANRGSRDLGLVSDFDMEALSQFDIGNGHKIPSLEETLDLIVSLNEQYREITGQSLTVNIELKGEGTAEPVHNMIAEYIDLGLLEKDDFVFNSFYWDRLKELKTLDPEYKVMPAIKTVDLFGEENVEMPGFKVREGSEYKPDALDRLGEFHRDVGAHAFDCIIFDLRPELVEFCEEQGVGLFTSTSNESVQVSNIRDYMSLILDASQRLPYVGFRADNVAETRALMVEVSPLEQAILNLALTDEHPYAEDDEIFDSNGDYMHDTFTAA